jgi:hypothetical protein
MLWRFGWELKSFGELFPHLALARRLKIVEEGCTTRTDKVKLNKIRFLQEPIGVCKISEP